MPLAPGLPGGQERTPWAASRRGPHPSPTQALGKGEEQGDQPSREALPGAHGHRLESWRGVGAGRIVRRREINISQRALRRKGAGGWLTTPPFPPASMFPTL